MKLSKLKCVFKTKLDSLVLDNMSCILYYIYALKTTARL